MWSATDSLNRQQTRTHDSEEILGEFRVVPDHSGDVPIGRSLQQILRLHAQGGGHRFKRPDGDIVVGT